MADLNTISSTQKYLVFYLQLMTPFSLVMLMIMKNEQLFMLNVTFFAHVTYVHAVRKIFIANYRHK